VDIGLGRADIERQPGQDRQLLRRIAAGNVHGRISLGQTRLSALRQAPGHTIEPFRVIRVRMKLQVPLTIPTRASMRFAINHASGR